MKIFKSKADTSSSGNEPPTAVIIIIGLIAAIVTYWILGQFSGTVNSALLPKHDLAEGSSHIVDVNARILERELNTGWAPSAHFFPLWVLTDLPNFQEGLLDVVTKSTQELNHVFRVGSEASAGDDLKEAANDIDRPANGWSVFSANSTGDRLADAVKRLDRVNTQLAAGKFPSVGGRIDLVASQISDFIILLSDEHTKLETTVANGNVIWGARASFYHAQGVLTGVCLEMSAQREDFQQVLQLQSALGVFDQTMEKACETLGVKPFPVVNGSGYSFLGGNVKTLSEHIGTVLYNLSAIQNSLAAAPAGHPVVGGH
jgi:hypothetical protein